MTGFLQIQLSNDQPLCKMYLWGNSWFVSLDETGFVKSKYV